MNLGPTEARAFMAAFAARWTPRDDRTVIFFPPAISVTSVVHALGSRTDLGVGVQNIWTEDKGAFTGETSAPMAKDAGAQLRARRPLRAPPRVRRDRRSRRRRSARPRRATD